MSIIVTHQTAMNQSHEIHVFVTGIENMVPYSKYREYAVNRPLLPIAGIGLYLIVLIMGQKVMQNRKPLHLKPLLLAWNTCLAVFSIISTIRFTSILWHQYSFHDKHSFFCNPAVDDVSGFWYMMFVYSKFAEFGDTLFLIVRKRRIMFLHWYHHVTVLLMSWIVFVESSAVGPFFGGVNVFIHSLMYTYYALQTIGIRLPKALSMLLTFMQMAQMLIGLFVVYQTSYYHTSDIRGCNSSNFVTISASIMYASYFLLFAQFFAKSYMSPVKRSEDVVLDVNNNDKTK